MTISTLERTKLERYAYAILKDRDDAQDVVQDALIYSHASGKVTTLQELTHKVKQVCIDYLRTRKRYGTVSVDTGWDCPDTAPDFYPVAPCQYAAIDDSMERATMLQNVIGMVN